MEEEIEVTQPQNKESQQPPETRRGKEWFHLYSLLGVQLY
jgi:hypothetical protein